MKSIGDTENTQATDPGVNFDQLIENVLTEDGVLPAAVWRDIVDQARLETDNYTSNVFKTDNNLFGYKYVTGATYQDGPGLLSPEGDNYAHYDSVENSIHEISGWWQRRVGEDNFNLASLTDLTAFANALKQFGYYGSSAEAYALRLAAVDKLVSVQAASGINTSGVGLTTISIGAVGVIALLAWLVLSD